MKALKKRASEAPQSTYHYAKQSLANKPLPRNPEERLRKKKYRWAGRIGGGLVGGVAGAGIGQKYLGRPMALGATGLGTGSEAGRAVGNLLGDAKNLEKRDMRGEELYSDREEAAKLFRGDPSQSEGGAGKGLYTEVGVE